ncbi:transcription factor bHLH118-like isoform X1 [Nicotiana tabacum]|uniref:Transcription factor bHLH118-like n=1 Tax=Nicotiana tabacum TaxID=4097 RepID=A0A1S3ZD38_TOBAC|nr:PREDICTED: transcription factor bHLH118-like [Nicotiana tabacum]
MDPLSEIFSFHEIQDYDLYHQEIQIPSTPCQIPQQDLVKVDTNSLARNDTNKKKRSRRLLSSVSKDSTSNEIMDQNKLIKRIAHRDIERQRRQEMAHLYASLRSHLPLEFLKGKPSASDHLEQAMNYIQHLENNINDFEKKRDKLNLFAHYSNREDKESIHKYNLEEHVTVNSCQDGLEILIKNKFGKEGLPLSKVLEELMKRKLNVVTCVSTTVDETSLHKIQVEDTDVSCMDVSTLEEKLAEMMLNLS